MSQHLLTLCYLIGSITFIVGLKMLSNPASARKGNLLAAGGMTIAILGTIFLYKDKETGDFLHNYAWFLQFRSNDSIQLVTTTNLRIKIDALCL